MSAISNAINKVKAALKKRGTDAMPDDGDALSVVHLPENRRKAVLLAGGAVALVLVCLAAWLGWRWLQKTPVKESVVQAPAKQISAPKVAHQPLASAQPVAAVAPEATHKDEPIQKEGAQKADALIPGMSSEPGSTPQPSGAHNKNLAAKSEQSLDKPESSSASKADRKTHRKARGKVAVPSGSTDEEAGKQEQAEQSAEHKAAPTSQEPAPALGGKLDKRTKQVSVQQQADNEFRKAIGLMQQGHIDEALAGYEAALRLDAGHDAARQALVALLLENKRNEDAERVLKDGLKNNIKHSGFAMVLARLQIARESPWSALLTLQKTLPYASQQADYQAFVAALLQRLNRHKEAVAYYQKALQLSPNSGVWLMGEGISLKALQRKEEARNVFTRAMETGALNEDLQAFVMQQLKAL